MKRIACLILAVLFLSSAGMVSADEAPAVYSYDFSFRFHLNAEIFPHSVRSHMEGYSELLDILEFRGNITGCSDTRSIDLHAEIVPVTNPSAAVSFRLYGIPEHMCLSSPLFGSETIWFQNYVFMEFALKAWNNLHIPVQYAALLYPYVTENAFRNLSEAWNSRTGQDDRSREIPYSDLEAVSAAWDKSLQDDYRLFYWISALSALSDDARVLELEFRGLPEYLLRQAAGGQSLQVTASGGSVVWRNSLGDVLFEKSEDDTSVRWSLSLPPTENGYIPFMSYASSVTDQERSYSVSGSYSRAEDSLREETGAEEQAGQSLPESLLAFSGNLTSFPAAWPADDTFTAALNVSGVLLPNFDYQVEGETRADGSFRVTVLQSVTPGSEPVRVLSCEGSAVPVQPQSVPAFSVSELTSHTNVFSINDQTSAAFVGSIRKSLFMGLLNFLYEVPARACQSVMDDLEAYGMLDMLSAQ